MAVSGLRFVILNQGLCPLPLPPPFPFPFPLPLPLPLPWPLPFEELPEPLAPPPEPEADPEEPDEATAASMPACDRKWLVGTRWQTGSAPTTEIE